jgi:hypothetical protein
MRRFALLTALALAAAAQAQVVVGPTINPANGKRYYRLAPTTWADANARAAALGGSLATIHESTTNEWVRANIAAFGNNTAECFIGINDIAIENFYNWIGGEPAVWFNWSPGEPNNGNGLEDLGAMIPSTGRWNDRGDWAVLPAIVEVDGDIRVPAEYPTIQSALNAALNGQTIVVAPGTYVGTLNFGTKRIVLRSSGGPRVTTIVTTNTTDGLTLAGGQGPETVIEGFTIRPQTTVTRTVVLRDSPVLRNCIITGAEEAGVFIGGSATISDCLITGIRPGLGIYARSYTGNRVNPTIQNCTIVGNLKGIEATADQSPFPTIVNINNCIIYDNNGQLSAGPESQFRVTHSNIEGGYPGVGNIDMPPRFVNAPGADFIYGVSDDFRLAADSPCVDRGNAAARRPMTAIVTLNDLDGNTRIMDDPASQATVPAIDMGALERVPVIPTPNPCPVDFNVDGFVDFFDYDAFVEAFEFGCSS